MRWTPVSPRTNRVATPTDLVGVRQWVSWQCGSCTKPRGIAEADLIAGAKIVTAANVVEYMASGASTLNF